VNSVTGGRAPSAEVHRVDAGVVRGVGDLLLLDFRTRHSPRWAYSRSLARRSELGPGRTRMAGILFRGRGILSSGSAAARWTWGSRTGRTPEATARIGAARGSVGVRSRRRTIPSMARCRHWRGRHGTRGASPQGGLVRCRPSYKHDEYKNGEGRAKMIRLGLKDLKYEEFSFPS